MSEPSSGASSGGPMTDVPQGGSDIPGVVHRQLPTQEHGPVQSHTPVQPHKPVQAHTAARPPYTPVQIPKQVTSPRRVLLKLLAHTVAMFTLPFFAYYGSKDYVEREYDMEPPKSFIYGAIAAVIMIQAVIFSYIYQAFQEEQREKDAIKASKWD